MIGVTAITELPITALPAAFVSGGQQLVTLRYASHSFTTRSSDSPAHQYIPGKIAIGLRIRRRLRVGPDGAFGSMIDTEYGDIELNNADGSLDALVDDFTADGRAIRLYIGSTEITPEGRERVQRFIDFERVYTSISGSWSLEHDILRLRIRDLSVRLRQRLQSQTYGGGGGETGTAELVGRTMPTAFGFCKNVEAQLVDPAILTYQVHAGSIQEIIEIYDRGATGFIFTADYPSYAALVAAPLSAGEYATSLATGHFRLGFAPGGRVTADIRGDKDNISGNHVTTHANVIRMILRDYSAIPSADIDHASFNAVTAIDSDAVMGLYLPSGDESTVEEVVERIALSNGCVLGQDRSGLFRIFKLAPPALAQHWSFDDADIIRINREEPDYSVPWRTWAVGYDTNWTVQDAGELAGNVTSSRRQFLESERRLTFVQDTDIAFAHLTSRNAPPRPSFFRDKEDADPEAQRLMDLYARGRALYRCVVKNALFSVELGQTVRLTYPRWNLANGKRFIVVGVDDDADNIETEILCFG